MNFVFCLNFEHFFKQLANASRPSVKFWSDEKDLFIAGSVCVKLKYIFFNVMSESMCSRILSDVMFFRPLHHQKPPWFPLLCLVSCVLCLVSGGWCLVSCALCLVSCVLCLVSWVLGLVFCVLGFWVLYLVSWLCLVSCVLGLVSWVLGLVSCVLGLMSWVLCLGSYVLGLVSCRVMFCIFKCHV